MIIESCVNNTRANTKSKADPALTHTAQTPDVIFPKRENICSLLVARRIVTAERCVENAMFCDYIGRLEWACKTEK